MSIVIGAEPETLDNPEKLNFPDYLSGFPVCCRNWTSDLDSTGQKPLGNISSSPD